MTTLAAVLILFDTSGWRSPFDGTRCRLAASYEVHEDGLLGVSCAPGGHLGAAGRRDGTIELFETGSGRRLRSLKGHSGYVYSTAFSSDARRLASGGWDGSVRVWNLEEGQGEILAGHEGAVWCVAFSPDGNHVIGGGTEGISVWDLRTGRRRGVAIRNVTALAASRESFATGDHSGRVVLWDYEARERLKLRVAGKPILSVAFHPSGRRIAAGSTGSLASWSLGSERPELDLALESGGVHALTFSSDGRTLAGVGTELRLWESSSGRSLRRVPLAAEAFAVAFARQGTAVLAACGDNRVRVWGPIRPEDALEEPARERSKGFLGVAYTNAGGALVGSVVEGSQAEALGFQANDLIVGCDDRLFASADDFLNFMRTTHEGQEVFVRIKRGGTEKAIKVKLGRWP